MTHEACCPRKKCLVQKNHLKKTTCYIQRTQTICNGYFGGYIGKRQPAGSLETKKCVDKLYTLRGKLQGKGRAAQLRAASGRLVTDLEMNSTYRGAVEFLICAGTYTLKMCCLLSAYVHFKSGLSMGGHGCIN